MRLDHRFLSLGANTISLFFLLSSFKRELVDAGCDSRHKVFVRRLTGTATICSIQKYHYDHNGSLSRHLPNSVARPHKLNRVPILFTMLLNTLNKVICLRLIAWVCAFKLLSLTVALDTDWDIEPIGEIQIDGFNQAVVFNYRVPTVYPGKTCEAKVYNVDCNTPILTPEIEMSFNDVSKPNLLSAGVQIDVTQIEDTPYYEALDAYRGKISFCTRVDCSLQGESVNFHETILSIEFDYTVGFVTGAALASETSKFKTLDSYFVSLYETNGDLSEGSLRAIALVSERVLEMELNTAFAKLNNTVKITASVLGQKMISKEMPATERRNLIADKKGPQPLLLRGYPRSLQETATGSEVEIVLDAEFESEPAPTTEEVNEAQATVWTEAPDQFLNNLTTVMSVCDSELSGISETDLEYAKSIANDAYVSDVPVEPTQINQTVIDALANMTFEELLLVETSIQACDNATLEELETVTTIENVTKMDGQRSRAVFSLSLGYPVDAFFCDASATAIPAPTVSQGDSVGICVTLLGSDPYYHVEDVMAMGFSQPSTGVEAQFAVQNMEASAVAEKICQNGFCRVVTLIGSRFFAAKTETIRVTGVVVLDFGPAGGRRGLRSKVQVPFSVPVANKSRSLQSPSTSDKGPSSTFELELFALGFNETVQYPGPRAAGNQLNLKLYVFLAVVLWLVTCIVIGCTGVWLWRRRKPESDKDSEIDKSNLHQNRPHPTESLGDSPSIDKADESSQANEACNGDAVTVDSADESIAGTRRESSNSDKAIAELMDKVNISKERNSDRKTTVPDTESTLTKVTSFHDVAKESTPINATVVMTDETDKSEGEKLSLTMTASLITAISAAKSKSKEEENSFPTDNVDSATDPTTTTTKGIDSHSYMKAVVTPTSATMNAEQSTFEVISAENNKPTGTVDSRSSQKFRKDKKEKGKTEKTKDEKKERKKRRRKKKDQNKAGHEEGP